MDARGISPYRKVPLIEIPERIVSNAGVNVKLVLEQSVGEVFMAKSIKFFYFYVITNSYKHTK